jgi:hypothetical protein
VYAAADAAIIGTKEFELEQLLNGNLSFLYLR